MSKMAARNWQVLIGDLRKSRLIETKLRSSVSKKLNEAIRATVKQFPNAFRLEPSVLRGDEIQAVLHPESPALSIVTALRSHLAARIGRVTSIYAGIGWGAIPLMSSKSAFESEGPAFHRARQAIDEVKKFGGTRRTGWISGDDSFDEIAGVTLPLLDGYFARWSKPQWEAVAHRLAGRNLEPIAKLLGVRFQSVHKRLSTAHWDEVHAAIVFLEEYFQRSTSSQITRQKTHSEHSAQKG